MPNQDANQAALQADGFWLNAYLSVYVGALVLEAEYDGLATLSAKFELSIVDPPISGSAANVKAGFRVEVYDSTGLLHKGTTRIRYAGTISSTNLPIRENSRGYIDLSGGDIVRVYADVRLSDKLVTSTADFNPDDLAYSDQGSNPPPTPNSGGAWAGWDTMLPIPLTGSTSFWNDPDSNGPLSHLWTYPTGLTGASTTDADTEITAADAGEYLPTHRVTDDDNSKATTQYVPIMVCDADNPPHDVVFEAPEWNEESGGSVRVRVVDRASLALIPDGAFVILWSEPNDSAIGLKSDGRSHIIMTGYIRREEGDFDGESGVETLTFDIISPMARLDELVGYSKVMLNDATPDAWSGIKTLMTKRGITQIIQFYSNLSEAGYDLTFDANYRNEVYPTFFLQEQTPVAQIRELADGTSARFVCLRDGSFEVHMRPELVAIGERSGEVVTLTLSDTDIINWQYTREHWRPVKLLELRGFSPGNSPQPLFSRWPGLAPGVGNESLTVERVIAGETSGSNQIWANEESGRRGGAADGIYVDDDGVFQYALDLELTLPGSYWGVLEFYSEYIAIDLVTTLRGLDLNDQLFVMRSKSFDYDAAPGTGTVRVTLRTATNAGRGQTYVPSSEEGSGLPATTPIGDIFDLLPIEAPALGGLGLGSRGTQTVAVFWDDSTLTLCGPNIVGSLTGFDVTSAAGGPVWGDIDLTALTDYPGGDVLNAVVVPDCPFILGTGTRVDAWVVTTTAAFKLADVFGARTISLDVALTGTTTLRMLDIPRSNPNLIVVVSYVKASGGVVLDYSDDAGATFASVTVSAHYDTSVNNDWSPGLLADAVTANLIITSAFTNTAAFSGSLFADGYRSTASTPSFSALTNPNINPGNALALSIANSYAAPDTIYHGHVTFSGPFGSLGKLKRVVGATITDISPNEGSEDFGPWPYQRAISLPDGDADYLVMCAASRYDAAGNVGVVEIINPRSSSRTENWLHGPVALASVTWLGCYAVSRQAVYLLGTNNVGFYDGATIDSRMGNLSKPSTGAVAIMGGPESATGS